MLQVGQLIVELLGPAAGREAIVVPGTLPILGPKILEPAACGLNFLAKNLLMLVIYVQGSNTGVPGKGVTVGWESWVVGTRNPGTSARMTSALNSELSFYPQGIFFLMCIGVLSEFMSVSYMRA